MNAPISEVEIKVPCLFNTAREIFSELITMPKRNSLATSNAVNEPVYRLIDLFCGAGGLTRGFYDPFTTGFESVWANDFDAFATQSYNANFGKHCVGGDIVELLKDPTIIPQSDLVVGGPPCQGFSLLNKNRVGDPRKQLWRPFFEVVKRSGAQVFLMENVPQLLKSDEYAQIVETAIGLGFKKQNIWSGKLCAADYGVPQIRWRAFIIGCKFADPKLFFPPPPTHVNPELLKQELPTFRSNGSRPLQPWCTVEDAIHDLEPPSGRDIRTDQDAPLNLHFGRKPTDVSMKRYKAIPKEGMNRFDLQKKALTLTPKCWIRKTSGGTDLFGRLWWKKPAVTIRTEFFKPEKGRYLHPSQHRPITHREAARLQSFPDDFIFCGSKISIARQIGNAVPPRLAAALAAQIKSILAGKPPSHA